MIKRLVVKGLHGRFDFDLAFNRDLNIFTGRNGSGKTTILKLLWYLVSGNLHRIPSEMIFDVVEIETDHLRIKMEVQAGLPRESMHIEWKIGKGGGTTSFDIVAFESEHVAERVNHHTRNSCDSIFFPTFRRIEGGYSFLQKPIQSTPRRVGEISVQEAVSDLSNKVSDEKHRFVASISTHELPDLLTYAYGDISQRIDTLHKGLSDFITERISDNSSQTEPALILKEIKKKVDEVSEARKAIRRPYDVLSELIGKLFQSYGIRITENITLGEAKELIASDKLSSGETQMLSFLCYNAFMKNGVIFIDEPELSLHVDWQRLLFRMLLSQKTGNQFIVATHSPMIYGQYPDKEIILNPDKGGE